MLRNYLAAAFGNLRRNWLYATITIVGLAVGFAAAILIGLYLRDEYSFESFIPGFEQVYRLGETRILPGAKPFVLPTTPEQAAQQFKLDFPQVERVARLDPQPATLKTGDRPVLEFVLWADPGFFRIMPYPVLAGDPNAALEAPDGLVLTVAAARKYFGQDAPIGRTVLVNSGVVDTDHAGAAASFHTMRVLAVIQDMPSNTNLDMQVFATNRAAFSPLRADERRPSQVAPDSLTYVKLKPGASAESIRAGLKGYADAHFPLDGGGPSNLRFRLTPIRELHFEGTSTGLLALGRPPGDRRVDAGVGMVGALIVIIAAINFVTLMTARATRRSVEVGIRKAVGARRRDLVLQFMGEALIHVAFAMVLAIAVAELVLPYLNAFLQRSLKFDYVGDPRIGFAMLAVALLTAVLAGLYPSLVLSGIRPTSALKGGVTQPAGSASVRQVLVVAQFAILIGLIVMTGAIYRQTNFALHDALKLDTSQVLQVYAPCRSAFRQEMERMPGVKGVSCGSAMALGMQSLKTAIVRRDRSMQTVNQGPVDIGFFELQGLRPLAGRFFARSEGADVVLDQQPNAPATVQPPLVINEAAARALGFSHPADAVGKRYAWVRRAPPGKDPPPQVSEIVGVAPDFSLGSIRSPIEPTIYYVNPHFAQIMLVKLDGSAIQDTLKALDATWKRTGEGQPLQHVFENQSVQDLYKDVIVQEVGIAICSGLAILIACLGLFAQAVFTTERRTKEIGIRKALGASTYDVMRLLLWQFTKPVLWSTVLAWPVALWVARHWLQGFAYRVGLPIWLFISASIAALLIAWATVGAQAWLAARGKPAIALRHE